MQVDQQAEKTQDEPVDQGFRTLDLTTPLVIGMAILLVFANFIHKYLHLHDKRRLFICLICSGELVHFRKPNFNVDEFIRMTDGIRLLFLIFWRWRPDYNAPFIN